MIVVIELAGAPTGLLVDAVFDIAEYPPERVTAPPVLVEQRGREHLITAVAQSGERIAFVLDLPRLLDAQRDATTAAMPNKLCTHARPSRSCRATPGARSWTKASSRYTCTRGSAGAASSGG